jgi:hypothetical protein
MPRTQILVAAVAGAALMTAPAVALAQRGGPSPRPGGGTVYPTKTVFSPKEDIDITWSDVVASSDVQFWIEPAGAPLEGYPHGSYHTDYEDSGHYALKNPGPGRWEVHWSVLAEEGVYNGGTFRVTAPSARRVAGGSYGCYTTTTMGLTRSSMGPLRIVSARKYRAMGRKGRYRYSRKSATLRFKSGPLRHRKARFRPDESPAQVVFLRRENERKGKPTIDISDTHCYRGQE